MRSIPSATCWRISYSILPSPGTIPVSPAANRTRRRLTPKSVRVFDLRSGVCPSNLSRDRLFSRRGTVEDTHRPASSWVITRPCRIGVTSTEPPVGALSKIGIGEELFPVDLPGKFSALAPKLARDITTVYPARGRPGELEAGGDQGDGLEAERWLPAARRRESTVATVQKITLSSSHKTPSTSWC